MQTHLSSLAVYRDPFHSLRKTLQLFEFHPPLASCVRRLWFNGYYGTETNIMLFNILRSCTNLDYLTMPWTTLRYGDAADWSRLLGRNEENHSISSLELLAVDLKQAQTHKPASQVDKKPLHSPRVNFSGLRRLKIYGNSNLMPIVDEDLIKISQSAANLREIHVTGTASVSIDGIAALMDSSDESLEVIEHSPLTASGFEHPDPISTQKGHICRKILRCPRLRNLSLSLPSLCRDLFADHSVDWSGEMQIRICTLCGYHPLSLKTSAKAPVQFWRVLDGARSLMASRETVGVRLDIEIFINDWIFEPRRFLVHGNLQAGKNLSGGLWAIDEGVSNKGPYGQTGLYGKEDGPYASITEEVFVSGLERRYISF